MESTPSNFQKIINKLNHHFTPMVNSDSARNKFHQMSQKDDETVAQYHVRLRKQVAKCNYGDPDDIIRSKILQTMKDGKLRREAMVKRYTLDVLLEHAANKEGVDRQAKEIEGSMKQMKRRPARV